MNEHSRREMLHGELTDRIIRAFYRVYNTLGHGFLEKVYENSLMLELGKMGLRAEQQVPIQVSYEGVAVGEYYADVLVEGLVLLEIKAADELVRAHGAQLLNYLRATGIQVGLLLNFGPKPEIVRRVI